MDEGLFGENNLPKGELRSTLWRYTKYYNEEDKHFTLIAALASSLHTLQQEVATLKEQLNTIGKNI